MGRTGRECGGWRSFRPAKRRANINDEFNLYANKLAASSSRHKHAAACAAPAPDVDVEVDGLDLQ